MIILLYFLAGLIASVIFHDNMNDNKKDFLTEGSLFLMGYIGLLSIIFIKIIHILYQK